MTLPIACSQSTLRLPFVLLLVLAGTAPATRAQQPAHFVPDWTFAGNTLAGWETRGAARWTASDGAITGAATGAPGWLVLEKSYQDVQFGLRFRCAGACEGGVLLRMQATADGGAEGVFVGWTDSLRVFHLVLDGQGRERSRTPLAGAQSQSRIVAADAPRRPSGVAAFHSGDWNDLFITLDANIVHAHVNGWGGPSGATTDQSSGFGPIALYAGAGSVTYAGIAAQDYGHRTIHPETSSDRFTRQQVDEYYYAWDTAVADINRDGVQDLVSGPYYFLGPDFTTRREIYLGSTVNPSIEYAANMITHAHDFTGDGWPDVLATEMRPMALYVNPQGENRRWDRHLVIPGVISESTILHDMDNDGQPEIVYALDRGTLGYAEPDPANPTAPWTVHRISESMGFGTVIHGLGAGDVNGDGRADILIRSGWFEQPANHTQGTLWTFHAFPFTDAGTLSGHGGGRMSVVDLDGDGLNDVATSLSAHGWGLAWFKQRRDAAGTITFEPHLIMGDYSMQNAGGVTFSQLHGGVEIADVDRDGVPDLVTGKRYWSHLDSSTDPDPYGEAVLYWYRTVRDANAPGGVSFVPERIHNRSGVGSQFEVGDMNGDGAVDIMTSTNRGTFIHWGRRN